jgi:hypothetical protein
VGELEKLLSKAIAVRPKGFFRMTWREEDIVISVLLLLRAKNAGK